MGNLKIKFSSIEESRRIQYALIALGRKPIDISHIESGFFLAALANGMFTNYLPEQPHLKIYKEISIDELEVMAGIASVKTKEYLDSQFKLRKVKQSSGDNRVPENWIEVPEGARAYISTGGCYTGFICNMEPSAEHLHNALWVRPSQPEELPFIDDVEDDGFVTIHKTRNVGKSVPLDIPAYYYFNTIRPKPHQRVYAVLGDKVPEQQRFVINGIDYTKAIQLGAKALQLAIRTFNETMKQK